MATDIKDLVNVIRLNEPDSEHAQSVVVDLLVEMVSSLQRELDSLRERLSAVEFETDWGNGE